MPPPPTDAAPAGLADPPLDAALFAPSKWDAAAAKAAYANALLAFLAADCPRRLWTRGLYARLSQTFGMIAWTNQAGFWSRVFADRAGKVEFLREVLDFPCWGSPAHTFCDAERAVLRRLRERGALEAQEALLARETEDAERAELARLRARFEGVPPPPPPPRPPTPAPRGRRPRGARAAERDAPRLL